MLFFAPQTTLAFAPTPDDLDDVDFQAPVLTSGPRTDPSQAGHKDPQPPTPPLPEYPSAAPVAAR